MENQQGSLAALLTSSVASNCTSITISDGNTYSGALATEAKKLFYVRKATNGPQVLYESPESTHEDLSWSIPQASYKDGWNYAYLLAVPKTVGTGNLASSYDVGDLIWWENDDASVEGFYIAAKAMGGVDECSVIAPDSTSCDCGCVNGTNTSWRKPNFDDFYAYINKKETGCDCATDMEYGYGEEFVICKSKITRNDFVIDAGCPCKCDYSNVINDASKVDLLLEAALVYKTNKNYQKGQTIIEEIEGIENLL